MGMPQSVRKNRATHRPCAGRTAPREWPGSEGDYMVSRLTSSWSSACFFARRTTSTAHRWQSELTRKAIRRVTTLFPMNSRNRDLQEVPDGAAVRLRQAVVAVAQRGGSRLELETAAEELVTALRRQDHPAGTGAAPYKGDTRRRRPAPRPYARRRRLRIDERGGVVPGGDLVEYPVLLQRRRRQRVWQRSVISRASIKAPRRGT